ncbi:MAG: DUF222 domain-containing protein [Acidobacteriota bacterium]|nr:DUF222 domain-containing protein [Acidobacteriota bacterium]
MNDAVTTNGNATTLTSEQVDQLADDIAILAARIDAATHELLAHIRRFDEAKGWARQGALSCAHWLSWRIGIDLPAAREKVRTARALSGLPQIAAALEHGELSYAKVRAMTRVADAQNETLLLDMARGSTGAQLEKIVRGFRRVEQLVARGDDERRHVRKRHVPADGMVRIELLLLPDEAERVWQALLATKLELRGQMDATAVASPAPDLADAAVAMAEAQLAAFEQAAVTEDEGTRARRRPAAERRQVLVHLCEDRLAQGDLRAELSDGTPLAGETFLRVACDAGLVVAKTDERGRVLDVGRTSRTVTAPLARALWLRDRHCRWPGCTHSAFVQAHHVVHWAQGGVTSLSNTLLLCDRHHRLAHEGGFRVEHAEDGQAVFYDQQGRMISPAGAAMPVEGDPAGQLTEAPIDRRTSLPNWDGQPLDLRAAVGALVLRQDRAAALLR